MNITPFIYNDVDDLMANCYVISDENHNCVVVDPSNANDGIINYIKKNNLTCKAVLLTHAHFDHMRGIDKICREFNTKLFVGFDDVEGLTNTYLNCSEICGSNIVVETVPETVTHNDVLHLLDEDIVVISTPYHTSGAVSYFLRNSHAVFTGDSLFKMSVGRGDLPGSKPKLMKDSISKLLALPDDTKVYPGHGRFTTIGDERTLNPFVKR